MVLTYSITKSVYKYSKSERFLEVTPHDEHKCNNHTKYDSFPMIFLQL